MNQLTNYNQDFHYPTIELNHSKLSYVETIEIRNYFDGRWPWSLLVCFLLLSRQEPRRHYPPSWRLLLVLQRLVPQVRLSFLLPITEQSLSGQELNEIITNQTAYLI